MCVCVPPRRCVCAPPRRCVCATKEMCVCHQGGVCVPPRRCVCATKEMCVCHQGDVCVPPRRCVCATKEMCVCHQGVWVFCMCHIVSCLLSPIRCLPLQSTSSWRTRKEWQLLWRTAISFKSSISASTSNHDVNKPALIIFVTRYFTCIISYMSE